MKITFHGAAGEVTGSKHLIQTGKDKILLDCGMHQGRRKESYEMNSKLPFEASSISAAILSHGHLDHCGMLPVLVRNGFSGNIYATPATIDIAQYILQDSARIQEQDTKYINDHLQPGIEPFEIIYSEEDAAAVSSYFAETPYFQDKPHWTSVTESLKFKFLEAGHILGSALVEIEAREGNRTIRLGFTGDIGKGDNPILRDPEGFREPLDALIMESTYGHRNHRPLEEAITTLEREIKEAVARKGKVIIPAFAIGRTQHLIYALHKLTDEGRIPRLPIYIDSPLAINITEVFRKHQDIFNSTADDGFKKESEYPLAFHNLHYVESVDESKSLNDKRGPFIVIASSGMSEGGRIVHHLDQHISDPKTTILITGYQAEHTLGRKIQDGVDLVNIYGRPHHVRAKIVTMHEFSAHADNETMLKYLGSIPTPKRIFLVHGEPNQTSQFKDNILENFPDIKVSIPKRGEQFEVE